MKNSYVILISGLPASGKTHVERFLEERLKIPLYSKDQFKEIMFDQIGWKDRRWSEKVGDASLEIMYAVISNEVACGRSVMVEGNFQREVDKPRFDALIVQHHFHIIEVLCEAGGETLWERFKQRAESGERHPGHRDKENLDKHKKGLLTTIAKPLGLGKLIRVNTDDMAKVDFEQIAREVLQAMQAEERA